MLGRCISQHKADFLHRMRTSDQQLLGFPHFQFLKIFCRSISRIIFKRLAKPRIAEIQPCRLLFRIYLPTKIFVHDNFGLFHLLGHIIFFKHIIPGYGKHQPNHMQYNPCQILL